MTDDDDSDLVTAKLDEDATFMEDETIQMEAPEKPPPVVVFGNEKGGSGKSTIAIHLAVALMDQGRAVACVDLDARQGSLSRFFHKRASFNGRHGTTLALPVIESIRPSTYNNIRAAKTEDEGRLEATLERFAPGNDVVVIDCPGSDGHLARAGHAAADILVTPLNDSFVDLDALGQIDVDTHAFTGHGHYAQMVEEQREKAEERRGGTPTDWIVVRNRLSTLDARNGRRMAEALDNMAPALKFRTVAGFTERVAYRELFLRGLTVFDLPRLSNEKPSKSEKAARHEIAELLETICRAL